MSKISSLALVSLMVHGGLPPSGVSARDASRPAAAATPTSPHAIPNPYAAPAAAAAPATRDRAADAYSTGFAIGLGTALINKQREDELKRQQQVK